MALSLTPIEIIRKKEYPLLTKAPWWQRVFLRDIAIVQNGFAFKSSFFSRDTGVPLIRIRDITKGITEHYYNGPYDNIFLVFPGDILVGMDGDFTVARWQGMQGLLNQRVCRIIPTSTLYDEQFLFIVLQPYLDAINAETSSVTVKHLSSKTIEAIPIPLPPLPEQHRIVTKIESLFSKLDKAVAELKKAKEKLELYRQSLLKAAFEGRLTEQWRKEHADELESAEELLARIKAEREKRFQQQLEEWKQAVKKWEADGKPGKKPRKPRKPKELPPLTKEELAELPELPEGWVLVKFGNVYDIVDGDRGKNYPKKQDFSNQGYCLFLNTKNVRPDGFNFLTTQFISKEKHKSLRKGYLKRGDVIFTSRGTIGNVAYYSDDVPFKVVRINSGMFILRGASNIVDPEYLLYCLQSQVIQNQITRFRSGTAQPQLPIREFQEFGLPIPGLEE